MSFIEHSFENVVKWMSENPAKLYNIKNKGFLKVGFDADITIVDMHKQKNINMKITNLESYFLLKYPILIIRWRRMH